MGRDRIFSGDGSGEKVRLFGYILYLNENYHIALYKLHNPSGSRFHVLHYYY